MSTPKHPKSDRPSDADLARNPGIGATKGTTMSGEDPDLIEADNTFEGDVESDPERDGGLDPRRVGRTNK